MIEGHRLGVRGCLDYPQDGQTLLGFAEICGWVLADDARALSVEVVIEDRVVATSHPSVTRPDVLAAYPQWAAANPAPGFRCSLSPPQLPNGTHRLRCIARYHDEVVTIGEVQIHIVITDGVAYLRQAYTNADLTRRRRKLERLLPLLQCPVTGERLELVSGDRLRTCHRGLEYRVLDGVPIMIQGEPEYPIEEELLNSPASNNPHPHSIHDLLTKVQAQGGLALDVGSGRRAYGLDCLVQLEICRYPFTDVVNQSMRLPFRDESFDLVFSLAVTEHVPQPWLLAEEMKRVVKKGGEIHVDSAFLQPLHGYPNHYYNMTESALESLFGDLEVISLGPAAYQSPHYSIYWILGNFLQDLSPGDKDILEKMSIKEFVTQLTDYIAGRPCLLRQVEIPPHRYRELAAGFTLHGVRKAC